MEITRIGYQKALNAFLPRKYTFVERVEITRGPGIKMGIFICNLNIMFCVSRVSNILEL